MTQKKSNAAAIGKSGGDIFGGQQFDSQIRS